MGKSQERLFEALNYGKGQKAKLTTKQYLVYSYLMSISKWDAQDREDHYYVYKNSFQVKDACALIGISQPTWRSAIKKLWQERYIDVADKYYLIEIPNTYAPLDINLIKFLLPYGAAIENGGNIVSLYSIIYKYWKHCIENDDICEITINQLRNIFNVNHDKKTLAPYKIMLSLFEYYGLIKISRIGREYSGNPYTGYIIINVRLSLTDNADLDDNAPGNIEKILEALNENLKPDT